MKPDRDDYLTAVSEFASLLRMMMTDSDEAAARALSLWGQVYGQFGLDVRLTVNPDGTIDTADLKQQCMRLMMMVTGASMMSAQMVRLLAENREMTHIDVIDQVEQHLTKRGPTG